MADLRDFQGTEMEDWHKGLYVQRSKEVLFDKNCIEYPLSSPLQRSGEGVLLASILRRFATPLISPFPLHRSLIRTRVMLAGMSCKTILPSPWPPWQRTAMSLLMDQCREATC